MLDRLPPELLQLVLRQLPYIRDLKTGCEISKSFRDSALPLLYESVAIIIDADAPAVIEAVQDVPLKYMKYLKHLSFERTRNPGDRGYAFECPNFQVRLRTNQKREHTLFDLFKKFRAGGLLTREDLIGLMVDTDLNLSADQLPNFQLSKAAPMLLSIKPNSLLSFRWTLRACLPALHEHYSCFDLLQAQQNSIENLSLETCPCQSPAQKLRVNLENFTNLRSLTWSYIASCHDLVMLGRFFKKSGETLRSLALSFPDMEEVEATLANKIEYSGWIPFSSNDRASLLFGYDLYEAKTLFPNLTGLSLLDFNFTGVQKQMTQALNISKLTSLKLVYCGGWENLLQALNDSHWTPKLLTFKLHILGGSSSRDECDSIVVEFLNSFRGLEELSLYNTHDGSTFSSEVVWDSILNHKSTLKSLTLLPSSIWFHRPEQTIPSPSEWDYEISYIGSGKLLDFPKLKCLDLKGAVNHWVGQDPPYETTRYKLTFLNSQMESFKILKEKPRWSLIKIIYDHTDFSRTITMSEEFYASPHFQTSILGRAVTEPIIERDWDGYNIAVTASCWDFANWAFSSDGLSDLQLIALGGFDIRTNPQNAYLLCRAEAPLNDGYSNTRILSDRHCDYHLWELFRNHLGMLVDHDI